MKIYANPEDARRELRTRPVEKTGIYVLKDDRGIHDARQFKAGDQVPAGYVFSHERDPRAYRAPQRRADQRLKEARAKADAEDASK